MNKNITFLFIVKNILFIQFLSCHTSEKIFSIKFFPNYGMKCDVMLSHSANTLFHLFCLIITSFD